MTSMHGLPPDDGMDRRLMTWLEEEAAPRAPQGLEQAFTDGVAHTRQRPSWATTERWISMETRARLGSVPRAVIVLATLALLTALAAGAIVVGSSSGPKLPPAFGAAGNGLIAYVSDGAIYVVEPDGSEPRQITSTPENESMPSWSRDGTRLAFWSGLDGEPGNLVVTDAEGKDPITVATTLGPDFGEIEWSADGTEIMYPQDVPGLGSDPCPVTRGNGGACGSRLFVAKIDATGSSQVGNPDLDARGPTLSPNGMTVAFGGGEAASEALYLMDWDGSDVRRLETGLEGGSWAFAKQSWSADGNRIVTAAGTGVRDGVWIVKVDDAGGFVASERLGTGFWPSYSPDGTAVRSAGERGTSIWTLGDETEFSELPAIETSIWAPDGTLIGIDGGELTTFGRDGGTITKLGPSNEGDYSWQRVLAKE